MHYVSYNRRNQEVWNSSYGSRTQIKRMPIQPGVHVGDIICREKKRYRVLMIELCEMKILPIMESVCSMVAMA